MDDPEQGVVMDDTRPLILYQLLRGCNTLLMIKSPSTVITSTVRLYF